VIGELLSVQGAIGAFVLSLVIFGFAPGMVLAAIVRLLPGDDPRRREIQAELYAVPRWEQPYWVVQQFEVAIRTGLFPEVSWMWGRHVWHRCEIESGLERHLEYPDSFEVPSYEDKQDLRPGDRAKLMWAVKRMPAQAERMWVTITDRDGDKLIGTLDNWAIFAFLHPGEMVKFHIDDIIDCIFEDEDEGEPEVA